MGRETAQTVERAVRILKAFDDDRPSWKASELASWFGLSRSIVIRILNTLEDGELVERDGEGGRYQIGRAALELGAQYISANSLMSEATHTLDRLVERTGLTAYLAVLDGSETLILACREGTSPVRFVWKAGARLPANTTAAGKAMLMEMGDEELDAMLGMSELPALTGRSLSGQDDLFDQLTIGRERGWITAREESHLGICAVGAPIKLDGRPVAGISLSFLCLQSSDEQFDELGPLVRDAATEIGSRLAAREHFGVTLAGITQTRTPETEHTTLNVGRNDDNLA